VPLTVTAADKKHADVFLKEHGVKPSDKLIALCPSAGASSRSRIWMPERFAATADALVREYLAKIILVSAKSEKAFVDDVAGRMKHASIPGYELNLKQQAAVYARCALVITNDSGPMHVAAAMGAPTLGLFCPNTPARWAPYGPGNDYLYNPVREKPCINTHKEQFPECKGHNHLTLITVDDVLQKARRMLHARRN
jgi:ADP-heptose:LPS heptosyltransferase